MNKSVIIILLLLCSICGYADCIDSLELSIRNNPQIQEKVYIHTDNQCYYLGDTLWYKAYVTRADDLRPTDISRILYVELLTPDGYLVERQQLRLRRDGSAKGQFALKDSLYSGYYELRAYTRWQLNFNVTHKKYYSINRHVFYRKDFERDYFRDYEGLYSRVFPVYEKPDTIGDYADKRIIPRPKQRIYVDKLKLNVAFFPEGGQLVQGLPCRMAFEVTDQDGAAVDITGCLDNGQVLRTEYLGRGTVVVTPDEQRMKAHFEWAGKEHSFKLPRAVMAGCATMYSHSDGILHCRAAGKRIAAVSIACRGRVSNFIRVKGEGDSLVLNVKGMGLPTGVNDIVVYDDYANPIAARQIFVNNNDVGVELSASLMKAGTDTVIEPCRTTVGPYDAVTVSVNSGESGRKQLRSVSVSVRDTRSDECTYDDGSILTDMILAGDLKGFVANPEYYFNGVDDKRQRHLDMLMMVQGWRKYGRREKIRYNPERTLTYEGCVFKTPDNLKLSNDIGVEDLSDMNSEESSMEKETDDIVNKARSEAESSGLYGRADNQDSDDEEEFTPEEFTTEQQISSGVLNRKNDKLWKKEIIVEAELIKDGYVASVSLRPDSKGHFVFQIPEYYGQAVLFVTAYQRKDSLKESLVSRGNEEFGVMEYPDLYVKRDWFFPNFVSPYSWFQTHTPEMPLDTYSDVFSEEETDSVAASVVLGNFTVRKFRKTKLALQYDKPAIRKDAYDLYNDVTDCGLSYGTFTVEFPLQAATFMFGYLGMPIDFKVRGTVDGITYYTNYPSNPYVTKKEKTRPLSLVLLRACNDLSRIKDFCLLSDYDKRADTRLQIGTGIEDITTNIIPVSDEGRRYVYKARRYIYPGYAVAEEFYSPDYSKARPTEPVDYRRTLYWNPDAKLNSDGQFSTIIYTGSRECRISVNACGVGADGRIYYTDSRKD